MNPTLKKLLKGTGTTAYLLTGPDPEENSRQASLLAENLGLERISVASEKGSLKIDQVREVLKRISFAPIQGEKTVVVIDEADLLTEGAANALLKTLEEPPRHVVFILTSRFPDRLPATVRSRCRRVALSFTKERQKVSSDPLIPYLRDRLLPRLRQGSHPFTTASELAQECLKEVEDLPDFFSLLQTWWRDVAVFKETGDSEALLIARPEEIGRDFGKIPLHKIYQGIDAILETQKGVEGNVLKQLALERLFYNLM